MIQTHLALFLIFGGLVATSTAYGQDASAALPVETAPHDSGLGKNDPIGEEPAPEAEAVETEAPSETYLMWVIGALGWRYALPLPLAALVSFVVTAMLLIRGKGKTTGIAIAFVVAFPALIGLIGMFDGILSSMMMMSTSTGVPKPYMVAQAVATGLVAPLTGLVLSLPSYLLATIGLSIRAFRGDPNPNDWPLLNELPRQSSPPC